MRIFLINWALEFPELIEVAQEFQRRGHQILYWVRFDNYVKVDRNLFPKTIFHEVNDALAGKSSSQLKINSFEPLGEEIIRQLAGAEVVFLSLMDKNFASWSTHQKKQFYYDLLKYWRGVINLYSPEAIIFNDYPHNPYTYVIYILAKLFKIKTIFFSQTWVSDRILVCHSYEEENPRLKEAMRKTRKEFSFNDLSQDLKEHYLSLACGHDAPYQSRRVESFLSGRAFSWEKAKFKMEIVCKIIKRGQLFSYIGKLFKKSRDNLRKEYQKLSVDFDPSLNYIYFPLQFQPERTSCPQAGVFSNQLLALEILSAVTPPGWVIYVKEHPLLWSLGGVGFFGHRFKGYYEQISKLRNVKIVSATIKSWQLIKHAKAVATLTGTAGWEALLREKSVLVFGHPFYINAPGVFKISDLISCRRSLNDISAGYRVDRQEIIAFLAAFDQATFHGYQTADGRNFSKITAEENKQNFLKILLEELL